MTRRLGKGDLYSIVMVEEVNYAETETTRDPVLAGIMTNLTVHDNPEFGQLHSGSRLKGQEFIEKMDHVANIRFNVRDNIDWTVWTKWLMGGDNLNATEPKSKRLYLAIRNGMSEELWGSCLNKLTLSSEEMGSRIGFEAEVYSATHYTGAVSVGFTDTPSLPLRNKAYWTVGTNKPIKTGKWKLTIDQKLQKVEGMDVNGNYTSASGQLPYLGDEPDITLEMTIPMLDDFQNNSLIGNINTRSEPLDNLQSPLTDKTISIVIGTKKLSITGRFDVCNPDRSDRQYEETIRFIGHSVTITNAPTS